MKYKIGQVVKIISKEGSETRSSCWDIGYIGKITDYGVYPSVYKLDDRGTGHVNHEDIEPITNSKTEKPMGRRKFILLKETPELKKGAIVEEMCDDGTQNYQSITKEYEKDGQIEYSRKVVMEQPKWFAEVTTMYIIKKNVDKVKKFIKKIK